jgi:hypothetical protein
MNHPFTQNSISTTMKTRIILALLVFTLLWGCTKEENVAPAAKADSEEQHIQPTNYTEPEAAEKGDQKPGAPNARIGFRIVGEKSVRVGTSPGAALEVDAIIPGAGEVLTGIGLRVDGDKVTTVRLRSRLINSNGTLSATSVTRYFGSAPNAPLEAWYEVPVGYVITGIGTRVLADNVVNLRVTYKKLKPTHLLEGSFVAAVGSHAGAFTEVQFTTGTSTRQVITGAGFTCAADNITTMKQIIGELKVPYVSTLQLRIVTGSDDLRGGNDNVNAHIHFKNGTIQTVMNINASGSYPNWSERVASLVLHSPVAIDQISHVRLQTTFSGGFFGDNWNLNRLEITAFGTDLPGALPAIIYTQAGSPLIRFTASMQNFSAYF